MTDTERYERLREAERRGLERDAIGYATATAVTLRRKYQLRAGDAHLAALRFWQNDNADAIAEQARVNSVRMLGRKSI